VDYVAPNPNRKSYAKRLIAYWQAI
jgi:hypothetical protein